MVQGPPIVVNDLTITMTLLSDTLSLLLHVAMFCSSSKSQPSVIYNVQKWFPILTVLALVCVTLTQAQPQITANGVFIAGQEKSLACYMTTAETVSNFPLTWSRGGSNLAASDEQTVIVSGNVRNYKSFYKFTVQPSDNRDTITCTANLPSGTTTGTWTVRVISSPGQNTTAERNDSLETTSSSNDTGSPGQNTTAERNDSLETTSSTNDTEYPAAADLGPEKEEKDHTVAIAVGIAVPAMAGLFACITLYLRRTGDALHVLGFITTGSLGSKKTKRESSDESGSSDGEPPQATEDDDGSRSPPVA